MSMWDEDADAESPESAQTSTESTTEPTVPSLPTASADHTTDETLVGEDALGAAGRALAAVENLPLERHPEAFAHFDELLRAALEAPPHVASG